MGIVGQQNNQNVIKDQKQSKIEIYRVSNEISPTFSPQIFSYAAVLHTVNIYY